MTSAGPSPAVRARWASTVGVLPRPMSSARQPPSSTASRKPSQRQRLGLVAAQLAVEALGRGDRRRSTPRWPSGQMSVAQPLPCDDDAAGERRTLEAERVAQDLGAGELRDRARARRARRRPPSRSTRSSSTHRPRDCTSGRASAASRATSAAVSSTSSNTTDQRTLLSWWAPTTESPAGSANRRSAGRRPCGATAPAPARRSRRPPASGRVTVMSSHASSWLRATWPRRSAPARSSAGSIRSSRATRRRPARSAAFGAQRRVDRGEPALARRREHREEPHPAGVGRVELHDEPRPRGVGDRPRPLVEPPRRGPWPDAAWPRNGEPSMRAMTVSARSVGVSRVRRRRRQLHALDALGDDRLDDRADHRDRRSPGRCRRRRRRPRRASTAASALTIAVVEQRRHPANGGVDDAALGALGRAAAPARPTRGRRAGRLRPRPGRATHARRRRRRGRGRRRPRPASRARPSSGWPRPRPAHRPGSGTPAWSPADRRAADRLEPVGSSSLPSGGEPRPPAHTTTWPSDHDACSSTSSGSHGSDVNPRSASTTVASDTSGASGGGGRSRAAVDCRPCSVSVKSATT